MADESIPKIRHQWDDAKGDPYVIRESVEGEPLLSADGRNAVPAKEWRWPTEPLVREVLRLTDENAALKRVVAHGLLDSRSGAAADALLDYREPTRTERSDRLADLEAERDRLTAEVERLEDERARIRQALHHGLEDLKSFAGDMPPGRVAVKLASVELLIDRIVPGEG